MFLKIKKKKVNNNNEIKLTQTSAYLQEKRA